jgi:hypothetical protein
MRGEKGNAERFEREVIAYMETRRLNDGAIHRKSND